MFETTYIFIGLLAAGTAAASLIPRMEWEVRMVSAAFSFILWIVWSLSSFNVERTVTDGNGGYIIVGHRYEFLGIVGFIAAVVMFLYIALYVLETYGGINVRRTLGVRSR